MGDVVLLAKFAMGIVGAILTIWLAYHPAILKLSDRRFYRAAMAWVMASRISVFVLVFLILNVQPQSDAKDYHEWTRAMLDGQTLYKEIPSCYMPLFHYALAVPVMLWDSGKSIILVAILLEIASIPIWIRAARKLFAEPVVRTATVLYLVNPIVWWTVAVGGTNQVWVSLFLGWSLLLLAHQREAVSAAMFGVSVAVVKFLTVLYAPVIALCSSKPVRWFAIFLAVPVIIYGIFRAAGLDMLASGQHVANENSSANLPYMVSLFGVDIDQTSFKRIADVVGVALLGALFLVLLVRLWNKKPDLLRVMFLCTLVHMAFMLVSKKSHIAYMAMCFFAVCLTLAYARLSIVGLWSLAIFSLAGSVEQSFWFRPSWMRMQNFHILWEDALPEGLSYTKIGVFFLLQIILLAYYAWCFGLSWRLSFPRRDAMGEPSAPSGAPAVAAE